MSESSDILVARQSAVFTHDGERIVIHKGQTRVRAGHPIVEGREDLFEPLTVHYDVETARQEPVVPTPAEKAAAEKAAAEKAAAEKAEKAKQNQAD